MRTRLRPCALPDYAACPEAFRASSNSGAPPSAFDDVALHGRENPQELVTRAERHAMAPHGVAQHLREAKELGFADAEASMRITHGIPGILTAAAGERADMRDDVQLQAFHI